MWIATAERMREMDHRTITEFGVPSAVLMERAGLAVFEAIKEMLPDGGRITIFCGRGNNGGDGLVVSRLAHQAGYHVDCLLAASESELTPESTAQLSQARSQGVIPLFYEDPLWVRKADCVGCRDLVVDALLGTGAKGELRGPILDAIQCINRSGVPILSVDIPSGIICDTGEDMGDSVWAMRTVTFGLPKPCLFQGIGLEHAGYWTVADIGYPDDLLTDPTEARLLGPDWVGNVLPERLKASHKGDNGRVLIVAGSQTMPGAAVLAARGALRAGAGLVCVASTPYVLNVVAHHLPEAIFLPLPEENGFVAKKAVAVLREEILRYQSAVIGPGLGHHPTVLEMLTSLWSDWDCPSVLDADALNAIASGVLPPRGECVMTPHPGEMARLLHQSTAEVQAERFQAVESAVDRFGKTVVLKGAHSIVGAPMQCLAVNTTGNPGMASAGMGDVLSGVIGALLAQSLPPYLAAAAGAYWHGLAGDLVATEIGLEGFQATDVALHLPAAKATITSSCDARSLSQLRCSWVPSRATWLSGRQI